MEAPPTAPRSLPIRRLRLGSGLVLLTYVTLHLLNHALGLVSLAAAERGLRLAIRIWQSAPGTALLYGAFALHFALALHTVYGRRHWRLPAAEWLRLWSGFSVPLLLIGHVTVTRLAATLYDAVPRYEGVIAGLIASGSQGWQIALLAPGWVHGGMGLWLGLRHLPAAQRARPWLAALLVALPLLSAAGFLRMSREVETRPASIPSARVVSDDPARPRSEVLAAWSRAMVWTYVGLVGTAFVAGRWRDARERARP